MAKILRIRTVDPPARRVGPMVHVPDATNKRQHVAAMVRIARARRRPRS